MLLKRDLVKPRTVRCLRVWVSEIRIFMAWPILWGAGLVCYRANRLQVDIGPCKMHVFAKGLGKAAYFTVFVDLGVKFGNNVFFCYAVK